MGQKLQNRRKWKGKLHKILQKWSKITNRDPRKHYKKESKSFKSLFYVKSHCFCAKRRHEFALYMWHCAGVSGFAWNNRPNRDTGRTFRILDHQICIYLAQRFLKMTLLLSSLNPINSRVSKPRFKKGSKSAQKCSKNLQNWV